MVKEIIVKENEMGQRLDKLLFKVLNNAPKSFVYKMLRKKNILLNDKKATGTEITQYDDKISIYLSDETFNKFSEVDRVRHYKDDDLDIVYEDQHIILINKPIGILSQKARNEDVSMNEYLISYLLKNHIISAESLKTFKPAICNRLDRNTSGILIAGKSLIGLQELSQIIKERKLDKFYLSIVQGKIYNKERVNAWLMKEDQTNKVNIFEYKTANAQEIITEYEPLENIKLKINGIDMDFTLIKIKLITGKTHQIRAHLASLDHPIIGDDKYGHRTMNRYFKERYQLNHQLLHANELKFHKIDRELDYLSNKEFTAELPEIFGEIIRNSR